MSSTIDSKPELNASDTSGTKPRFTLAQLIPPSVTQTLIGPNKAGWTTTGIYIAGAVLCLAITGAFAWMNAPAEIAEYGKVGQKFFAEFVDPTLAKSLEVSVFDADRVEPREFKVAKADSGQWVIPSHHDYPADAEEQLADTASSVIGVQRGAMVTRWAADHAKYGVIDPRRETLGVDEVEGVGQRLTLRGDKESVLADFIVGNQVDGEFDQFYVRHPEEDEVYITTLDVDLSTKFTDWIDTDLFDLSSSDVRSLTANDYSFDELSGRLTQSEITTLTREGSGNDWKLDSAEAFDEAKEEINSDAIRDTLSAIAGLKISGVRPKQKGLTPDLKLDRDSLSSQIGVERLQADLLSSGFLLQPSEGDDKDQLKLLAREGELLAGTKEGLVYRLHFGRVFTGSQEELEVGFVSTGVADPSVVDAADVSTEDTAEDESAAETGDDKDGEDSDEAANSKPGRYVFVRVDFDQTLLGDAPAKPTEPTKPERLIELEEQAKAKEAEEPEGEDSDKAESANESETNEADSEDTENAGEESTAESDSESSDSTDSELETLRSEFSTAESEYKSSLSKYEDYQSKLESGKEKADELNRRFAKWYYVISGESYDKLALNRAAFVSVKEQEDSAELDAEPESADESEIDSDSDSAEESVTKPNESAGDDSSKESADEDEPDSQPAPEAENKESTSDSSSDVD